MNLSILNMNRTTGERELNERASTDTVLLVEMYDEQIRINVEWARHWHENKNTERARVYMGAAFKAWHRREALLSAQQERADELCEIVQREVNSGNKTAAWMDEAAAEHADWLDNQRTMEESRY